MIRWAKILSSLSFFSSHRKWIFNRREWWKYDAINDDCGRLRMTFSFTDLARYFWQIFTQSYKWNWNTLFQSVCMSFINNVWNECRHLKILVSIDSIFHFFFSTSWIHGYKSMRNHDCRKALNKLVLIWEWGGCCAA